MATLDLNHLNGCITTLDEALAGLSSDTLEPRLRPVFRAAAIKEFELILEQAGKLLRRCLKLYAASSREVDQLSFKDLFRRASRAGILDENQARAWLAHRDWRNRTAHDYGEDLAEDFLSEADTFLSDAKSLMASLAKACPDDTL